MHSTIPTVKRALVDQLSARPGMTGVQIAYSEPQMTERECVYLSAASGVVHIPGSRAGRKTREERYVLTLVVRVSVPGAVPAESDQRACDIAGEIEDLLVEAPDGPTLGSLLKTSPNGWAELVSYDLLDPEVSDEGYTSVAHLGIAVTARLT